MAAVEFDDHRTIPNKAPTCADYIPLEFSMHSFEHFEVIIVTNVILITINGINNNNNNNNSSNSNNNRNYNKIITILLLQQ